MDSTQIRKETRLNCNESFLTLLSGFRKTGVISKEDIAYNAALGDAYDYIVKNEQHNLLEHTVRCGKWVRDLNPDGLRGLSDSELDAYNKTMDDLFIEDKNIKCDTYTHDDE